VKYDIVEEKGFILIKISGETRKNEAVMPDLIRHPEVISY
jgi:hypothetical protein